MAERIRARFDVVEWNDVDPKGGGADGSVTSALVQKMFQSGLSGTSHATVLMTKYEGGAAYTAIERFRGALGDRSGEISFVHGGIHSEAGDVPFGYVVPGSGTDGFAGASGTLAFGHADEGGFIDFELTLPPEA